MWACRSPLQIRTRRPSGLNTAPSGIALRLFRTLDRFQRLSVVDPHLAVVAGYDDPAAIRADGGTARVDAVRPLELHPAPSAWLVKRRRVADRHDQSVAPQDRDVQEFARHLLGRTISDTTVRRVEREELDARKSRLDRGDEQLAVGLKLHVGDVPAARA